MLEDVKDCLNDIQSVWQDSLEFNEHDVAHIDEEMDVVEMDYLLYISLANEIYMKFSSEL